MKKEHFERMGWWIWTLCLAILAMPLIIHAIYTMIVDMIATPTFDVIATFSLLIAFIVLLVVGLVALFLSAFTRINDEECERV